MRIWDTALDHGPDGTTAVLSIPKLICKTVLSDRVCPMDECKCVISTDCALCEDFLALIKTWILLRSFLVVLKDLLSHGQHLCNYIVYHFAFMYHPV